MREGTAGVEGLGEEQACKQVFSMGDKHNFDPCKWCAARTLSFHFTFFFFFAEDKFLIHDAYS